MRKLLMATTAGLSGLLALATAAEAQVKLNDGTTLVTPFTAGGGIGSQSPQPGNIVVHFDGKFAFTSTAYFDQKANYVSTTAQATGNPAGAEKQQVLGFTSNTRLQPGFDGVAANGLQYGVYVELRDDQKTNNIAANYAGSVTNTNGLSLYAGATNSDLQQRTRGTFYIYADFGYIGSQYGIVKVGQQPVSNVMLLTGTMENFADGAWHATQTTASQLGIGWAMIDNSVSTGRDSIQYLSPQIYGFDASVTYAPNESSETQWSGCTLGTVGPGCNRLTTSTDPGSFSRTVNWVDAAVRYRGTLGPIGFAASAGAVYASTVKPGYGAAAPTPYNRFKPLEIYLAGAQVSYSGLLVGGHIEGGNTSYQNTPEVKGAHPSTVFIAGASYTRGAFTIGSVYNYLVTSLGVTSSTVHDRTGQGPMVGAQYILAPGVLVYAAYFYAMLHQVGYNLQTQSGSATAGPLGSGYNNYDNNRTVAQIATLGAVFTW